LDFTGRQWRETGEDCIMRNFRICTFHQYYWGDQVNEDELGGACNTHGEMKNVYKIFVGNTEEKKTVWAAKL